VLRLLLRFSHYAPKERFLFLFKIALQNYNENTKQTNFKAFFLLSQQKTLPLHSHMRRKELWTNVLLGLIAAALLAICIRSVTGEAASTHKTATQYDGE